MHDTSVAVDLAKSVFQLAVADDRWKVIEQHRLTRSQFERWFANRRVGLVVMEACGSAHHWARWLVGQGIEVRLLSVAYVRAYVRRNKTDAADACALLEAARCADIEPVRVNSLEQQAPQGLHRIRSLWMSIRLLLSGAVLVPVVCPGGEMLRCRWCVVGQVSVSVRPERLGVAGTTRDTGHHSRFVPSYCWPPRHAALASMALPAGRRSIG